VTGEGLDPFERQRRRNGSILFGALSPRVSVDRSPHLRPDPPRLRAVVTYAISLIVPALTVGPSIPLREDEESAREARRD